jgi:hypothetical protein
LTGPTAIALGLGLTTLGLIASRSQVRDDLHTGLTQQ